MHFLSLAVSLCHLSLSRIKKNTMEQKSVSRIDRKSSIETEPRTLSFRQIECAREAALFVMKTRSIEEALNIFTEGLETVISVGSQMDVNSSEDLQYCEEYNMIQREVLPAQFRDIVTAPF